jgi:hypothetical protein
MLKNIFFLILFSLFCHLQADFATEPVDVFSGVDPKEINVADIDNDGSSDIVFVDNGVIKVLYQDGVAANQKSLRFNGNQNAYVNSSDAFNSANFTVSFWVKFPTLSAELGTQTFFTKSGDGSNLYRMTFNSTLNQVDFLVYDQISASWIICKSTVGIFSADTWYHVVGVHSAALDKTELWIDNVMMQRTRGAEALETNNLALSIGSFKDSTLPRFLNAQIDEFAFFKTGLSTEDISLIHTSFKGGDLNKHPQSSNLSLWLTMGDSADDSTVVMSDRSSNKLTAYLSNFLEGDYIEDAYQD